MLSADPAGADSGPPQTVIYEAERGSRPIVTRLGLAEFRYRALGNASRFQCSLDRKPWRGCRPGLFRRYLAPGRHVFRVRAIGRKGVVDPTPAVRRWKFERWRPRVEAASKFAASRAGRTSFVIDVGWRSWGIGSRVKARMASTIKAMLMVAYLRKSTVRNRGLRAFERGLISPMITVSDNFAANVVASMVGTDGIRRLARVAGLEDFEYSTIWGTSTTTTADQARFMRALPNLLPDLHRDWALGLLTRIEGYQRWGVPKVRPAGWKLFFKGGWGISDGTLGGTVNHQIALLRRSGVRIGLAIFTQGNPWTSYGEKTLREVARRLLKGLPGT
jgi:hypothetical protein